MFAKLLFKRILPTLLALAILVLGGLWLYGYFGVKQGWINLTPSRYTSWTRNTPFAGSFTCAPSER